MSRVEAPEDLLVRARQGLLSEEEERRLGVALQSSRELELLYDAGVQFDADASLLPGDEERMAALVQGVLSCVPPGSRSASVGRARRRPSGARYFAASLAAGALFAVAVASAWQYAEKRHWLARSVAGPVASAAPSAHSPAPAAVQRQAIPSAAPAASVAEASSAAAPLVRDRSVPGAVNGAALATPPTRSTEPPAGGPSASLLFASASEARRAGDIRVASALYQRLCAEYPSSVEADDAKILLGNLLLSQRSPRAALRQFESYDAVALTAEALWGEAEALRQLGSSDERGVLDRLARDYPNSPYAPAAQKRVQELTR
ncbi:MAG: hypothetical protein ABI488_08755 [Polyangiaceae bacterium]